MKILLPTALLTLCVGCSPVPKTWHHDTVSTQQYHADQAECTAMASSAKQGTLGGASHEIETIYENCMKGKGYYR